MVAGSNFVVGTTGRNAQGVVDRDYFTFTIASGFQLDALLVLPGSTFLGPESISFIAFQAGPQFTVSPTSNSPEGLLGYWLYGPNDLGLDILQLMGSSPGAVGFFGSLPAGSYSVWIQETGTGVANYTFDFQISQVPEPGTALFMAAGLAALGWRAGVSATGLVGCRKAPLQEEPTLGFSEGCLSASMHSAAAFVLPATRVSTPFTRPRTGLNPFGQILERRG
jgi:hypothetical protein